MNDAQNLLENVIQKLADQLGTKVLGNEFYYQSLPLSAIDAVFSSQAKYPSVQNVIRRYSDKYDLAVFRPQRDCLPPQESQEGVSALIQKMKQNGIPYFIEQVFV
ncbi:MAG: hypothetical protein Q8K42_03130, partial [Methylobacter sp.]|nr:hypothetical protein [Methylobacter sp.]